MKSTLLLKTILVAAAAVTTQNALAQLDSCNAFLKGRYIEVGIAPTGSFGSNTPAPTGYHANYMYSGSMYHACGGTGTTHPLGFIADPDMDGWTTGTPPFYGDFFLPGSPFEGWSVQIGSSGRSDAWNTLSTGFTGGLSGSNISYTATGSTVSSTWEGVKDSVDIKQVTSLDTNNLYFSVKVTFTNMASVAKDDIYYFRTVDPDNDQMQAGGSFMTRNKIEHQSTDTTVVSAVAVAHSAAYVALGSVDSNATCLIYSAWPLSSTVDLANIYNQTYTGTMTTYTQDSVINGDIAIGLTFHIPHLASLDSAGDSVAYRTTSTARLRPANAYTITYFVAFSTAARDSAIRQLSDVPTSGGSTTSVRNVNGANINVYPNPAKDVIYVTGLAANDRVSLHDMMGRETNLGQVVAQGTATFTLGNVPTGSYILLVKDTDGNIKSRARIQKQ